MGWLDWFKLDVGLPGIGGGGKGGPGGGGGVSASRGDIRRCSLDELLEKVSSIEKECCVEEKKIDRLHDIKDEFVRLKAEMYLTLETTRTLIRERHAIQRSHGNTVEAIQKGSKINDRLRQLESDFKRLADIYTKQCRQRAKLNLSDEELEGRYRELNVMKKQIYESKQIHRNASNSLGASDVKTLTDLRRERREQLGLTEEELQGRQEDEEDGRRERRHSEGGGHYTPPTDDDVEKMNRWKSRDRDFDEQVEEIGEAIDRIGEVAVTIGEKADQQNQMTSELHRRADEATEELQFVNNRLKQVMQSQNSTTFCCKICMAIVLLLLICFVFSTTYTKYIKRPMMTK